MAKTTTCPVPQNSNTGFATIVNGTGALSGESGTAVTGLLTAFTAGSNDSILESLIVSSSDTSARTVQFYINDGTNSYLIGSISIPAGAGITSGTTANVDLLGGGTSGIIVGLQSDPSGKPCILVKTGHTIKCGVAVAVTAAKTVQVIAMGADY